jgi:hypothetical protein
MEIPDLTLQIFTHSRINRPSLTLEERERGSCKPFREQILKQHGDQSTSEYLNRTCTDTYAHPESEDRMSTKLTLLSTKRPSDFQGIVNYASLMKPVLD